MSRIGYQFATETSTGWTNRVSCDLCRAFVEREGPLPKSEREMGPKFAPRALAGWANFSMRLARAPAGSESLDEDLWPRLDRDLCPSCANVIHDWLCDIGCGVGTSEERFLDALGRPAGGQNAALGETPCMFGPPDVAPCLRRVGHDGSHSAESDAGTWVCPTCFGALSTSVLYDQPQLESHAVDQHSVRYSDGELRPRGWYTEREGQDGARIIYADVQTALRAERVRIEGDARAAAPRLTRRPIAPGEPRPWVHDCVEHDGDTFELSITILACPACGVLRP